MLPRKVDLVLRTIDNLRPIPSSVTRILKEIDNPYTTVSQIADYIGLDQALTASIIKASNSVTMGYSSQCTSITDAVMRLGFKRIKAMLFTLNAVGPMNGRLNGYRLGGEQLWVHSLKIAMSSEWLAKKIRYRDPEEAYVVGLLHDIGKLLLDQFVFQDYQNILQHVKNYHMPVWQVEEKLIGIDHANLGGMMSARWNFPLSLAEGIRYHHAPSEAKTDQQLPAIVNLANYFATQENEFKAALYSSEVHPDTLQILKLEDEEAARLKDGLDEVLGVVKQ